MKYKIVPDDIVKNMIEFLDEVQFEAAKDNTPDALHKINFCNWMISELMHSLVWKWGPEGRKWSPGGLKIWLGGSEMEAGRPKRAMM